MFVSNVENLGATLDQAILTHFATSGISMLMEVRRRTLAPPQLLAATIIVYLLCSSMCVTNVYGQVVNRTEADSDLAHLAKKGNRYVLRERAQCPEEDLVRRTHDMLMRGLPQREAPEGWVGFVSEFQMG
eukprot:scaffold299119_cov32-Tisochrysis_lutea.AAC.5